MSRRERGRWEKNLQLSTMVRAIQKIYKKIRYRYWTTNERRNIDPNQMGYKRRRDTRRISCNVTRSNTPNNTIRIPKQTDKIKIKKLIKLSNKYCFPEKNIIQKEICFERYKQTQKHWKTTVTNWLNWKTIRVSGIKHRVTYIEIYNVSHRQETTAQTFEINRVVVPKVVEQIKQKINDRNNKKNTIPEALKSNRDKNQSRNFIQNYVMRKKRNKTERETKRKNWRFCNAPDWIANHKFPPENQYVITAKTKGASRKFADPNAQNNKKLNDHGTRQDRRKRYWQVSKYDNRNKTRDWMKKSYYL